MARKKQKKSSSIFLTICIVIVYILYRGNIIGNTYSTEELLISYNKEDIPEYSDTGYVILNNNNPYFDDYTKEEFEIYGPLDSLGRCTYAYANVSKHTMPKKKRESIGMIKPSGWHISKYDFIDGKYLYNRCHLIGYQLTGENANEKNLITCTREMNTGVMLEYENKVASYVKKTKNHVMYRVTPIFEDNNLVAKGVIMEGYSVEDSGAGIKFNIFVYNVQDGVIIDYSNGENYPE